jgi:hypothetical protein
MRSMTTKRTGGLGIVAILVAACGSGTVTPSPPAQSEPPASASAAPPTAPVVTSEPTVLPTEEPTVAPTAAPVITPIPLDPDCPNNEVDDVISVQEYVDAPTSCFRYGVRVRGWLDTPPPLGFEPPLVKPSWIYYPSGDSATSLWHQPPPEPDHVCATGEDCWWFFPHPDPDLDLDLEPLERWVILTGHTRDPRAENCHYDGVGPNPNPELVVVCGRQFVVTAIEEAP